LGEGKDPSNPNQTLYHYALAGDLELEKVLQESQKGAIAWAKRPLKERLLILHEVAHALRCGRGMLVGAMVADTGKTAFEADVEISEAIDFVEYYRRNVEELHQMRDIEWSPKGPILVASPWNFPCSIPVGGIAAALAGGNSVIFKPAPEAVLVGWQLANLFWEAGVDRNVLQFFCCEDDSIGSKLIQDSRLKAVILTGATSTAKLFLRLHPGLDLMAETGGKNALIITGMSDRDLAIKDLVQSAFGHAGQKCSACSLAILEKEVYDDPHFRKQLHDAASSLKVGVAWNPATKVNPLIREPNADLLRGLTKLEEGEEWLLKPQQDPNNPQLWSPGIKLGVKAGSFMHQTELFGPVLGVMRARNLEEAIALANATPYGLTSGIHSLDEREHTHWLKKIVVGNCYINRGITGAIVRRQPFGGCKESSFGPGAKAGGPNYLMQMMIPQQKSWPSEREGWNTAVKRLQKGVKTAGLEKKEMDLWETSAGNYAFHWIHYFSKEQDPSQLRGQDNLLRYVPHPYQVVRIQANDWPLDVWRILAAALTCKAKVELSLEPGVFLPLKPIRDICKIVMENEDQLIARLKREKKPFRMRLLASGSLTLHEALGKMGANVIVAPILANGRIELLHWLREISISYDYHRYGYLGEREK
jgi:RHH-type proline utilization regulon transcriptional repressor/proline dehydrogenase/delta 1-pyrroline-5-carboxylate dehydrogenase